MSQSMILPAPHALASIVVISAAVQGYGEVVLSSRRLGLSEAAMARAHGSFNVVSGLWPLLHRRSFEAVLGPKQDYWLVATVALLLLGNGAAQLAAQNSPDALASARRLGLATAAGLLSVDLVNVARGRISKMYLLDAAAEMGWLASWMQTRPLGPAAD
jgi:hypothetical protein